MSEITFENKLAAVIKAIRQKLPLVKADAIIRAGACLGEGLVSYGGRRYDEYSIVTMVNDFAQVTGAVDLRAEFYNYYGGITVSLVPGIMATAAEIAQWQEEITALTSVIMENRTAEFDGIYNTYENDFEGYVEDSYKKDYPRSYSAVIDDVKYEMPAFIRDVMHAMVCSFDKKKVVKVGNGKLLMEERELNEEEIALTYDAGFATLRDQQIGDQYRALFSAARNGRNSIDDVVILRMLAKSLAEGEELPISFDVNGPAYIGRLPFLARRYGMDARPVLGFTSVITKEGILSKYSVTHSLIFVQALDAKEYIRPLTLLDEPSTELDARHPEWFEHQARMLGWALFYLQPEYVTDANEYAQSLIERDGDALRAAHAEWSAKLAADEAAWAARQNGPITEVTEEKMVEKRS